MNAQHITNRSSKPSHKCAEGERESSQRSPRVSTLKVNKTKSETRKRTELNFVLGAFRGIGTVASGCEESIERRFGAGYILRPRSIDISPRMEPGREALGSNTQAKYLDHYTILPVSPRSIRPPRMTPEPSQTMQTMGPCVRGNMKIDEIPLETKLTKEL